MNLSKTKLMVLLCGVHIAYQPIGAMHNPPLMPPFEPSTAAQELANWGGFNVSRGDPRVLALDKEKIELYRSAWQYRDYPETMDTEVKGKVILHLDVMEAVLQAATQARDYSRDDYITVFFMAAARTGNINALTFFLDRGVKINEIKGNFDKSALDIAIENEHEEAIILLLSRGATRNKLPVKKIG